MAMFFIILITEVALIGFLARRLNIVDPDPIQKQRWSSLFAEFKTKPKWKLVMYHSEFFTRRLLLGLILAFFQDDSFT